MNEFSGNPDEVTLAEAKTWLREQFEDGARCPCCSQNVKLYKFHVNASQAVAAIRIWKVGRTDWVDVVALQLPHNLHAHLSKLRFWGVLEPQPGIRDDGSNRVGIWRVTDLGQDWVLRKATIPSHAMIFNNRCFGITGEPITIEKALGKRFDYRELMGW